MKNKQLPIDLADVLELVLDAVCVVDRAGDFVFVSAAFEDMFGYAPDEVVGTPMVNMVHPEDRYPSLSVVESMISGQMLPRFENRWIRKDGEVVYVLWSARWSESHQVRIAVAHDITERKVMEAALLYAAGHDDLIGLPNRILLLDRLQTSMTLAEREQEALSVLFIDIDGFKEINDIYGHAVGDEMLQKIASRLDASVRKSDTVGRLGGDEFLIVLNKTRSVGGALSVAEKIRSKLALPFVINDTSMQVYVSIGIACFPSNAKDVLDLVQVADHAMYQAKNTGGNKVVVANTSNTVIT